MSTNSNTIRNGDLSDLVSRLKADALRKRDVIVPAQLLFMDLEQLLCMSEPELGDIERQLQALLGTSLSSQEPERFALTATASGQLRDIVGIPAKYWDTLLKEQPDLLTLNVTDRLAYIGRDGTRNYMLRTFSPTEEGSVGVARAVVSDRYKRIDNYDILATVLETIKELKDGGANLIIDRCDLSDDKMFVRVYSPTIEKQAPELLRNYHTPDRPVGDHVIHGGRRNGGSVTGLRADPGNPALYSGFIFGNSETGKGSFFFAPRVIFAACANGYRLTDEQVQKIHLGARQEEGEIVWSDEVKQKELELVQLQLRDAIRTFMTPEYLGKVVDRFKRAAEIPVEKPVETIKELCQTSNALTDGDADKLLEYFLTSNDRTVLGIGQAITFYAQEKESGEEQFALEREAVTVMDRLVAASMNLN